jgi:hypothetical protein
MKPNIFSSNILNPMMAKLQRSECGWMFQIVQPFQNYSVSLISIRRAQHRQVRVNRQLRRPHSSPEMESRFPPARYHRS